MQHKTQSLHKQRQFVTIRKFRRKVGGDYASIHDIFWREDEPWVVLQLPSGHRTAVPASWTDLASEHIDSGRNQAEIHPLALIDLAQHCRDMKRPRSGGNSTRKKRRKK